MTANKISRHCPNTHPGIRPANDLPRTEGKPSILFLSGGTSAENQVALLSAQNVYGHIDFERFNVVPVLISPDGQWFCLQPEQSRRWPDLLRAEFLAAIEARCERAYLQPVAGGLEILSSSRRARVDLIFPILHGPCGEDGTLQGLAQFFAVPVVGSDMSGSLLSMDKVLMKGILQNEGIPSARYHSYCRAELAEAAHEPDAGQLSRSYRALGEELFALWQCPALFVKPARMGSSVGISQVKRVEELGAALQLALRHDDRLLIEEGFCARELELAVLELDGEQRRLQVSNAAQIRSNGEFYSYEQKYFPEKQDKPLVVEPYNDLSAAVIARARKLAEEAFRALRPCHYARVDLFYLEAEDRLLFNELNTIPGFTANSMFPQLMAAEGWPMPRLVPHLIDLALRGRRT